MKEMALQDRNTLKSKQALRRALQKPFYQLRVLSEKLAKLTTRLHTNRITAPKLSQKSAYAVIPYCGEDKRCFAIEEYRTGLQLLLHKSCSAFTEGHQAQRY